VSESTPGKSDTDLVIETFVDRMEEIHPNLDREEFREAISGHVRDAVEAADAEEKSEDEEG
jgi:hypothetical protein